MFISEKTYLLTCRWDKFAVEESLQKGPKGRGRGREIFIGTAGEERFPRALDEHTDGDNVSPWVRPDRGSQVVPWTVGYPSRDSHSKAGRGRGPG